MKKGNINNIEIGNATISYNNDYNATYHPPIHSEFSTFETNLLSLLLIIPSIISLLSCCFILFSILGLNKHYYLNGESVTTSVAAAAAKAAAPSTTLKRLIFCMTICIMICTIFYPFAILMLPKIHDDETIDWKSNHWSLGNEQSCEVLGFFNQFLFTSFFYSTFISYYYMLVICYQWKEETFAKYYYIEIIWHLISWLYPIGTGIAGIVSEFYDELEYDPTTCWINNHMYTIILEKQVAWTYVGSILLFVFVSLLINTILIYKYKRRILYQTIAQRSTSLSTTNKRSSSLSNTTGISNDTIEIISMLNKDDDCFDDEASMNSNSNSNNNSKSNNNMFNNSFRLLNSSYRNIPTFTTTTATGESSNENNNDNNSLNIMTLSKHRNNSKKTTLQPIINDTQERRVKLTSTQAFLSIGSFFICCIWTSMLRIIELFGPKYKSTTTNGGTSTTILGLLFLLLFLQSLFLPLQGFFTFLIYIRPIYMRNRKSYPQETKLWSMKRSIFGEENIPQSYLVSLANRRSSNTRSGRGGHHHHRHSSSNSYHTNINSRRHSSASSSGSSSRSIRKSGSKQQKKRHSSTPTSSRGGGSGKQNQPQQTKSLIPTGSTSFSRYYQHRISQQQQQQQNLNNNSSNNIMAINPKYTFDDDDVVYDVELQDDTHDYDHVQMTSLLSSAKSKSSSPQSKSSNSSTSSSKSKTSIITTKEDHQPSTTSTNNQEQEQSDVVVGVGIVEEKQNDRRHEEKEKTTKEQTTTTTTTTTPQEGNQQQEEEEDKTTIKVESKPWRKTLKQDSKKWTKMELV